MEGFSHTVSRRSRQHRNGKQAGPDDSQKEKKGCETSSYRFKRFCCLGSRGNFGGARYVNVTAAVRIMKNATALEKAYRRTYPTEFV
jgi:hypothetical protein